MKFNCQVFPSHSGFEGAPRGTGLQTRGTQMTRGLAPGAVSLKSASRVLAARLLLVAAVGLAPALLGQGTNNGVSPLWQTPPGLWNASAALPIDALNFWNPSGATFFYSRNADYQTSDTLNFTNQGAMVLDPGFDFETYPSITGQPQMANSFVNLADGTNGTINCSSGFAILLNNLFFVGSLSGSSRCIVEASNILNTGTISMDASSLIKLDGYNVDVSRGTLSMNNLNNFNGNFLLTLSNGVFVIAQGAANAGFLDNYWGVGIATTNFLLDANTFFSDFNNGALVTTRQDFQNFAQLDLPLSKFYIFDSGVLGSNRWVTAVFLQNTNPAFINTVYFPGASLGFVNPDIAVQWQWSSTNAFSLEVTTNYLYVTDDFEDYFVPPGPALPPLIQDGTIPPQAPLGFPTQRPENYNFVSGTPFSSVFPTTAATPTTLSATTIDLGQNYGPYTNYYTAYSALFTPMVSLPTDLAWGNVTNQPGRVEITARNLLSLTNSIITTLNYLQLNATNHFAGAPRAQISSPNSDFYLRTTNGVMQFSNLVAPWVPDLSGPVELWSGRYTNVDVNGITNAFHIMFVDSEMAPILTPLVQTLDLTVTNFTGIQNNLYISDILNVTSNLLINTEALTITTNNGDFGTPAGQLNFLNPIIVWPTVLPGLQYLTNWGQISNANSVFFGGSLTQPPYNPDLLVNVPYQAFVNHGNVINQGSRIWSVYFENEGTFQAGSGSISLDQAFNAVLTNGAFFAGGDITIDSASLLVSNHTIIAAGALTLSNSYYLDDGSYANASALNVTNKNFWSVEGGINLPVLPTYSSLLGTTVTNIDLTQQLVNNTWAGADLGATPAGFARNAALGHLILDGRNVNSLFEFSPPGAGPNALYVDLLELNNFATNQNAQGNSVNIKINSGMTIYFGRALLNGVEFSAKLNGTYGVGPDGNTADSGQFVWVPSYSCGFFSSTNLFYPGQAKTNMVNSALAFYCANEAQEVPVNDCSGGLPTIYNTCPPVPAAFVAATAPAISVSAESADFTAPAAVNLSANVAANGHSITKVLFYSSMENGASLVGSNAASPYSCTWSNVSAGSYSPTAVVVYDQGAIALAAPVHITVKAGSNDLAGPSVPFIVPPPADTNISAGSGFIAASYHGLFFDTNNGVEPSSSGYFVGSTTKKGAITAKISVAGHTYAFSGHFGTNRMASGTTSQGFLKVQLQLISDNLQILGTISNSTWSASLQADQQTSRSANTFAGNYTLIIPPSTNGPQGYGFGTVVVDAAGNLKWSGDLADGTKVTQSSAVSQQGFWPLFAPLSSGGGEVISWMQFASNSLSGDLVWTKASGASGKTVPGPFTVETTASGEIYHKQVPAFDMAVFSGGGLSEPLTNMFTLAANHHAKDITGSSDKLTLGVTASSGLFSGSILNPGGPGHLTFSGAVWSPTNAVGFFLNNGQSGSVTLQTQP